MKTAIVLIILLIFSVNCDARRQCGYSSGYSGSNGHRSFGYSSHRNSYSHGRNHHRGFASGDRTPSGYYGRSPGLRYMDRKHELKLPGPGITGNSFYRGVDTHGALKFGN